MTVSEGRMMKLVFVLFAFWLVLSTVCMSQTKPGSAEKKGAMVGECHPLLGRLNMEDFSKIDPEQLLKWQAALDECVLQHADQFRSNEDWQEAVLVASRLSAEFYRKIGLSDMNAALKVGRDLCGADYDQLVFKYNDLARDYNKQRELLVALSARPLVISAPSHCTAWSSKSGTWTDIDCY
jgi:hypothetical protein